MKVRMDTLKCNSHGILFSIEERTKTELHGCRYMLRTWPGEILSTCILMYAQVALCNWILYLGDTPGFLFCKIVGKEPLRIIHDEP